jgi:hypothetical protein
MATIEKILADYAVSISVAPAADNPALAGVDVDDLDHWMLTFSRERERPYAIQVSLLKGAAPTKSALVGLVAGDLCELSQIGADEVAWLEIFGFDEEAAEETRKRIEAMRNALADLVGPSFILELVQHAVAARVAGPGDSASAAPEGLSVVTGF